MVRKKRRNNEAVENKEVKEQVTVEQNEQPKEEPKQEKQEEVKETTEIKQPKTKEESKQKEVKPKTFNQRLACKTFDCLYEEFKDDPEYSKVILPFKRYRDFIKGNGVKDEKNYVRHNYDLYTSVKVLLSDKDITKVSNYIKLINKILLVDSEVFNNINLLAYDYRWTGTDKSRREWLTLFTVLLELAHPAKRKNALKIIDLNKGLSNLSPAIADNIRKFYSIG